jgi:hypothetical protein
VTQGRVGAIHTKPTAAIRVPPNTEERKSRAICNGEEVTIIESLEGRFVILYEDGEKESVPCELVSFR